MPWQQYQNVNIVPQPTAQLKSEYSITADILSFQLCPSQYGFFAVKKYQPAQITQEWFGTIIHQVLDKLHLHYLGLFDPNTAGQIPTDSEIETYFNAVEDSLRARGVKAINQRARGTALRVLRIFNTIEGSSLYPNVIDTEYTLQADRTNYILHGKVDLLKNISSGSSLANYDPVEIWDYKGTKFPDINNAPGRNRLNRYKFQLLTYAQLYQLKTGNLPIKGLLYFMNELNTQPPPTNRPTQAVYELDFRDPSTLGNMNQAIQSFDQTVANIEQSKIQNNWPTPQQPDKETCDICDIRWKCDAVNYPMRYP